MAKEKDLYEPTSDEGVLISIYNNYKLESEAARLPRIQQNKINYDAYNLRQDFSYKTKGQSQEFLPKLSMAVEEGANFLQTGLVTIGEWFKCYPAPGMTEDMMKVKPFEIQKILNRQLEKAGFLGLVGDAIKLGFLGSLMIAKVHGKQVPKAKYEVVSKLEKGSYKKRLIKKEDKKWQLEISLVRQQDWRPDPTRANGMFKMQTIYMDWYELEKLAKMPNSEYDLEAVNMLKSMGTENSTMQEYEKARETGQATYNTSYRKRIELVEMWGNLVSPNGELLWEHCAATIANGRVVVKKPTPIKFWHGEDPYIVTPILRVPHSAWGKTPMDSGAMLNIAMNEIFNLVLDGGLAAVHGIKQIREAWLEDPSQIEEGIQPGITLRVNTSCPPGATALERVDTTTIPPEVLPVFNLLTQEFVAATMQQDLRTGVQAYKDVKATQLIASEQQSNAMFGAIATHIEADFLTPLLYKAWLTCCQHMDDFDDKELTTLLGEKRASEIMQMGPEELFKETADIVKFEVFGMSATLNKQKEFTKLQSMLQTIASSPLLMEEFSKKYDFAKLLTELLVSLDVPIYKIMQDQILAGGDVNSTAQAQPQGQPNQVPNAQSQIPQAGAAVNQTAETPGAFAQPKFPGSPALTGMKQS